MSEVNQALSQLAKRRQSSLQDIKQVIGTDIKQKPRWIWAVGGFLFSLAVGSWAVSTPPQSTHVEEISTVVTPKPTLISPTQHTTAADVTVYKHPVSSRTLTSRMEPTGASNMLPATPLPVEPVVTPSPAQHQLPVTPKVDQQPNALKKRVSQVAKSDNMSVKQVSLTPEQLAFKAKERAEKALDSNDYDEAIMAYQNALRYTPDDENIRKNLAALYYGKEELRRAYQLLQEGIQRNPRSPDLRLALAQLLVQEKQITAAVTPLKPMLQQASVEYLSFRAALATKNHLNRMALESYQQLVILQPNNARWWLGLGIQQERANQVELAKNAYEQALTHVGISSSSIAFVQERLQVLETVSGSMHAN